MDSSSDTRFCRAARSFLKRRSAPRRATESPATAPTSATPVYGAAERTAASWQELAMRVRRLQQQGGKRWAAWREHCERYGRNTLDPGWHSADFLRRFLDEHE